MVRSGTGSHPNAAHCCTRIRIICLTKHLRDLLPDDPNVERNTNEDEEPTNIPQLIPSDDPIPPLISKTKMKDIFRDDLNSTDDAFVYVAGAICKKLNLKEEIEEFTDEDETSWLGLQNRGKLKKPKDEFVKKIKALDHLFNIMHPEGRLKEGKFMLDRTSAYITRTSFQQGLKISKRIIQFYTTMKFHHCLRVMQTEINGMNRRGIRDFKQLAQHQV